MGLTKIPWKFHSVSGHFDVSSNSLVSLENAPRDAGSFDCSDNPYLCDNGENLPELTSRGENLFRAKNNRTLVENLKKENLSNKNNPIDADYSGVEKYFSDGLKDHQKFFHLRKKLPEFEGIF
jgi:hypothetical protein